MLWLIILSAFFTAAFGLAGVLYPGNRNLLLSLCALSFIFTVILAWRQNKDSPPNLEEIRNVVREEVSDVSQPPQLSRLKRIAQERGISADNILDLLEGGTYFDKGLKALLLHQYDDAIHLFEKSAAINKKHMADSLFYIGNAFMFKTDYIKAVEYYRKANELNPTDPWSLLNYGAALEALKRYDDAAENILSAINLNPEIHFAYNNLGNVQHKLKKFNSAIKNYERAIELKPEFGITWLNLGNVYMDMQEYQTAAGKYEKAAELMPDFAPAYNSWAVSLCKLERHEESLDKFERAVTLEPNFEIAWFNWFLALDHLGRKDEAAVKLKKSSEIRQIIRQSEKSKVQ